MKSQPIADTGWAMSYTSHLGYEPPDRRMQFIETLGTADAAAHVRYAKDLGMAGVLYPWALQKPKNEIDQVRAALQETGLKCSTVVCMDFELLPTPIWSDRSRTNRQRLGSQITRSSEIAASLGSEVLAVLIGADPQRSYEDQRDDVSANLKDMGALAAARGLKLGVEPMLLIPGMLLRTIPGTLDLVRRSESTNVGVIYDTGHVSMMHDDVVTPFVEAFAHIVLLQFADQPGRVEPGAGELDIVRVAVEALRLGYSGLVDLEHGWQTAGKQGEVEGVAALTRFDHQVRRAVEAARKAPRA